MIDVCDVVKQYHDQVVVDHVSVQIPRGGLTAIIGPNGAGKSTLLGMISRLTPMTSGAVHVGGMDVSKGDSEDLAKKLAILRQDNHLPLRLTVQDIVAFGRFPHTKGRLTIDDKTHIDQAIAYMNLTELADKFLDELSGGQRQRAFIAMVLCQGTDYVLLDEPLNSLDMKNAVDIMKVLRRAARELGKTVVVVLHDINFASCYADHIIGMRRGQVAYQGSVDAVIKTEVLGDLYNMPIHVHEIHGQKICVYY
jgi:iron complex transport system ATP-binding protein